MRGVLLVEGVTRDDGVEVRRPAVGFGTQHAAEPLRLLLARAERAAHLDGYAGLRKVDRDVGHLADDQNLQRPVAEFLEEPLALLVRRRPLDDGGVEQITELAELGKVSADDEHPVVLVPIDSILTT